MYNVGSRALNRGINRGVICDRGAGFQQKSGSKQRAIREPHKLVKGRTKRDTARCILRVPRALQTDPRASSRVKTRTSEKEKEEEDDDRAKEVRGPFYEVQDPGRKSGKVKRSQTFRPSPRRSSAVPVPLVIPSRSSFSSTSNDPSPATATTSWRS